MNGPSPQYLAELAAALGIQARASGGPISAGSPYLVGEFGPELVTSPAMSVDPRMSVPLPLASEVPAPMPAPTAAAAPAPPPPAAISSANAMAAAPIQQASAEPPRPSASFDHINVNAAQHGEFPLVPVGGSGVIPAHEVDQRGPTLRGAQASANATAAEAIGASGDRSAMAAQFEYNHALEQEREARAREAAAMQSVAERDEELAARQADFDQSSRQLAKMSVDPNRFWASRNTGQKIGAMISIALGGFLQGARGGSNPGLDAINTAIERDIHSQELAYQIARDANEATRTAFGMAMQKYQNVDVARSMARVSALDAVGAQIAQDKALEVGTAAANNADMMLAQLEQQRAQQIQHGVKFILPKAKGRRFFDRTSGMVLDQAQALKRLETLEGRAHDLQKIDANAVGDIVKEKVKGDVAARAASQKDVRAQIVTLPNGDTIRAPSDGEAAKLRDLSQAVLNAQQLVAEAKAIRSDPSWVVSPTKGGRLKQIESELTLAFKDRGQLGALSGPDMDLARNATAELTSVMPGVDARLDAFAKVTDKALRNRVRTYADAPATAKGEMPASFTPHGGK